MRLKGRTAADLNYDERHVAELAEGTFKQQRLLKLSPVTVDIPVLESLYRDAMRYW